MRKGIEKDNLIKDIEKLEYQNNEINKDLSVFYSIKKDLEKSYTSPTSQGDVDNAFQRKVNTLRTNRENEIRLLKDKVTLYTNVTKKTEKVFSSVKTSIKIE